MATVGSRGSLTRDYWKGIVRTGFMLLVPSCSRLKAMVGRNLLTFLVARESWEFVRGFAGGNFTVDVPS